MDGVSITPSPTTAFNNDRAGQVRPQDEPNQAVPNAPQQPEAPRVNEGPSTITTISPQAQQLARQEQSSASSPRKETQAADLAQQQSSGSSTAQANESAAAEQNNGRAFDDQSSSGALLRN
jgi:hypothetical protein